MEEIKKLREEFKLIAQRQIIASLEKNAKPEEFKLATKEYAQAKQNLIYAQQNCFKYSINFLYSTKLGINETTIIPYEMFHYSNIDTDLNTDIDIYSDNNTNKNNVINEITNMLTDSHLDLENISELKIIRVY